MPADYYADNAQQRRKRRRKRRSRRLLTLLLIAALVLTAYKVTDGFTRISMRTHVPKDNIETDFNIDLDAIAAQANSADKGFYPSGADIEALNKTASKNPEYKEEIEFFIAHIGAYDQTGVNTVLLAPEKTPFVLLAPFAENTPTGGWDIEVKAGTVPYFIQYDSRWAFYSYGSSCMGNTACGPTCLASSRARASLTARRRRLGTCPGHLLCTITSGWGTAGGCTWWCTARTRAPAPPPRCACRVRWRLDVVRPRWSWSPEWACPACCGRGWCRF